MEEVVPKMTCRRGSVAGQSREASQILQLMTTLRDSFRFIWLNAEPFISCQYCTV